MSAPGSCVWAALFDWTVSPPGRILNRTNGTSYAVAHLAGVATLRLAHHGHAASMNRYGSHRVQAAFLHLLRTPGVCARPPGWDDDWGVGRVDAEALLGQPLPDPAAVDRVAAFGAPAQPSTVDRIAALTNVTPTRVHDWLDHTLGPADLDARADRFAGELTYLLLEDPSFRASLAMPGLRVSSTDHAAGGGVPPAADRDRHPLSPAGPWTTTGGRPQAAPGLVWVPRTVTRPLISAFAAGRPRSHGSQAAQHDLPLWPSDSRT